MLLVGEYRGNLKGKRETAPQKKRERDSRPEKYSDKNKTSPKEPKTKWKW